MLITLILSLVAMKSRTFPSLWCSANEQVCRSWEGAQPGGEPKLAHGNIPYQGYHAHSMNGLAREQEALAYSGFCEVKSSLVQEFELFFRGSVFFGSFEKFAEFTSLAFCSHFLGTGCELVIGW